MHLIKDSVVREETRCFVKKAFKHFPEFVTQLLNAIERDDIPADPEDDDEKFSNETFQADQEEEENTEEWSPNICLQLCLSNIIKNYPVVVCDYLLPYVKTAITVSV